MSYASIFVPPTRWALSGYDRNIFQTRQTWPMLGDDIGPVERFFHSVFGNRGTTDAEAATSGERSHLTDLQTRLTAAMGRFTGAKLAAALELSTRVQRHLQTYPETEPEKRAWIEQAVALEREVKRMLPTEWLPFVFAAGAVGLFGFAIWRFKNQRQPY